MVHERYGGQSRVSYCNYIAHSTLPHPWKFNHISVLSFVVRPLQPSKFEHSPPYSEDPDSALRAYKHVLGA